MGASGGVAWLRERGLPVLALSGVLTSSPLAIREVQEAVGLPVLTPKILCDPGITLILEDLLASEPANQSVSLEAV
jgi:hypothetical protein